MEKSQWIVIAVQNRKPSSNPFGDPGTALIASHAKKSFISTLNIANVGATTESFKIIAQEFSKAGLGTIYQSIRFNLTLTSLNISLNAPGIDGIKAISDLLTKNVTLTSIGLEDCQLGDSSVGLICQGLLPTAAGPSTT